MRRKSFAGLKINNLTWKDLFNDKVMYIAYMLIFISLLGVLHVIYERYLIPSATAFDAGLNPGSRDVALAMKEAVFGSGGEVKREAPWSLYIVNYMYMIYTGSGIIFLVAFAEFFHIDLIKRAAAGFMTLGLAMVLAGLFTILLDLNFLNLHWMILSPKINSGMWLMLPLYIIYIPLVVFEIYLLIANDQKWARKLAFPILILSLLVELTEFYIQAKLFNMNLARTLWTSFPGLTLYFIISSFVASSAIMMFYSFFTYRDHNKRACISLMELLSKVTLYSVITLGFYEIIAYLIIDSRAMFMMLFGPFSFYVYSYFVLTIMLPFSLLFWNSKGPRVKLLASIFVIIGTYLGRMVFIYGGNAYPLSDRFGVGFEKYGEYEPVKDVIFFMPSWGEMAIVLGSIGIVIFVYRIIDSLLSVSLMRKH
ncbi:polysulfide reductase [Sulfurovum sp.]|uniref:polysulfide reductase n=1 Tax=Sulfurovum sp. TaxID=1969726 RepID=UPI0028683741|nr:polysulfide reductase [Sulfurovum sp.]